LTLGNNILKLFTRPKKESIPSLMCFIASLAFIGSVIPTALYSKPSDPMIIFAPIFFGIFLFLLSLVLDQDEKYRVLKKRLDDIDAQRLRKT